MRHILLIALVLGAAACERSAPALAPHPPAQAPPAPVSAEPAYPFVGLWAVNADYCRDFAWTFAADHIATPGEVYCDWTGVEKTAGGYRLPGRCLAEGEAKPDTVRIDFDGEDTMMVTAQVWRAPTRLIRCAAP